MKGIRIFAMLWAFAIMVFGTLSAGFAAEQPATTSLVVKLVNGLAAVDQAAVIARDGGVETSSIPALRLHVITVLTPDLPLILQNYQSDAQVESVELNKARKAEGIPNDLNYGLQWALSKIGWESLFGTVTPSGSAKLAILDTGIDAAHPDLASNIISGTSILDGTNGLSDPNGHGTSLAGIAAALTANGEGIAGIGYAGVRIMPVTVLGANGIGQDSDIIAGIIWAADQGADVILMGFSNPDFSQNLQDAVDYAWLKGAVLVAATGNDGVSTPTFPAGDRGVVGVSATDQNDALAFGSNFGQDVFLAAPGVEIFSTSLGDSYTYISGTSASSAVVAGVAAFMKAVDPSLTNGVIVGRLARSADAIGSAGDPNNPVMFGNGRVNMSSALADNGTDVVQPAGAAPVGEGGPYVGPYMAAAVRTITSISSSSQSSALTRGAAGSTTYTITVTTANGGPDTTMLSVTLGLPTGATASFPNPVSLTNPTFTTTMTVATTAATPAGTFSLTIANSNNAVIGQATLVIGNASQAIQAITVDTPAPDNSPYGSTFNVAAHASSGLAVAITTSGSCSGNGSSTGASSPVTVTMTSSSGACTVKYDQGGNTDFSSATQVIFSTSATTRSVTVTGLGAINKPYDGNTSATITGTGTLSGVVSGDTMTLSGTPAGAFTDPAAGNSKTVTISGLSLSGAQAGNYTLTQPTASADITAKALTVTGLGASNKPYDGNTSATITGTGTLTGVIGGDTVTLSGTPVGAFADPAVGNGKTVTISGLSLSGAQAGNYMLTQPTASADITAKALTVTGLVASNKPYDGNTSATITGTGTLTGVIGGDTVTLSGTPVGAFADPAVGIGKTVTISGLSLSGAQAGNYTLTQPTATADITAGVSVPTGTNVVVTPAPDVQLTFNSVTSTGSATANTISPTAPANFTVMNGSAYNIAVTNTYSGPVTMCLKYNPLALQHPAYEQFLKLFHFNGSSWVDITTSVDTGAKKVCGVTSSFSPFMIVEPTVVPSCGAPSFLTVPATNTTGSIHISWGSSNVSGATYILEQSYNGGAYSQVFSGTGTSTNIVATANGTYSYRVKATKADYADSGFTAGSYSTSSVTLTCGAPSFLTVPATNTTGSIAISWGGSDVSGSTYVLEQSFNGQAYSQVYSGTGTSANIVATANGTYAYHVKATKANYADSGYTAGSYSTSSVTLTCGAPTFLTVPATNSTGSIAISWGGSDVSDSIYVLEQSFNGQAYSQVYSGTGTSANIVATANGTYAYRVQATKANYAGSGYTAGSYSTSSVTLTCGAPTFLTVPATNSTGSIAISWGGSDVSGSTYVLEQSYNGQAYSQVYSGTGTSANLVVTANGTYSYRVQATKANYAGSGYTAGSCNVTLACGAPSTLSVPATNSTGSIAISWGGSDVSGSTYILEQSYNGGTYNQVYSGTGTSTNLVVTANGSYAYRVKATKANYAGSDYTTGSCDVTLACGAPPSLSVPATNSTGSILITWGASDVSGATYVLEQSYNGQAYTQVYSGTASSANLVVTTNGSYSYRVKATKANYVGSGYTDGIYSTCSVALSCGAPLSLTVPATNTTGSISISWGVSDVSGSTYILEQSYNGGAYNQVYSGIGTSVTLVVTAGGNYAYQVKAHKAGFTDSSYTAGSYSTCSVTLSCGAPVSLTVPGANTTGSISITWGASNVSGATYVLEQSLNGGAYSQVYSGTIRSVNLVVTASGTYSYRVKATKASYTDSGYTAGSYNTCNVTLSCGAPISLTAPATNTTGNISITWGASNVSGSTYVLEQSYNGGAYNQVYSGTGTSTILTVTANGSYAYRVKATKANYADSGYTAGSYSTCSVTLICGIPSSITVPANNSTGSFTVTWGASNVTGVTYVLEQGTDGVSYPTQVYSGPNTNKAVSGLATGTYFFRVKAIKANYTDSAPRNSSPVTVNRN